MGSFRFFLLCSVAVLAFTTSSAAATSFLPEASFEPIESPEPSVPPFVTAVPIPTEEPEDPLFESAEPTEAPDYSELDVTPAPYDDTVLESPHPSTVPHYAHTPEPSPAHASASYAKVATKSCKHCMPAVCFFEKRKCCYRFKPCGFKVKKVVTYVPFVYKVCHPKKVRKCYNVPKKVLTKECKYKKIEVPCKHPVDGHSYGYKKCEPTYVTKKVCCDKWVIKYDKVCKDIIVKEYKIVKGKQIVIKFYKYVKYCPKLECGEYYKQGNYKKPHGYLSKGGKLIREVKSKKITHSATPYNKH